MPERALRDIWLKSCEMYRKERNFDDPGSIWEHFEAPWELLGSPVTSLGTVWASI